MLCNGKVMFSELDPQGCVIWGHLTSEGIGLVGNYTILSSKETFPNSLRDCFLPSSPFSVCHLADDVILKLLTVYFPN